MAASPPDSNTAGLEPPVGTRHQAAQLLPDGPNVRAEWTRGRIIIIEMSPGVKGLGDSHLVIDDQLWRFLKAYWEWKDTILRGVADDDPRRRRLLLGKNGRKVLSVDGMAALWREAGFRAHIKIRPGEAAALTLHSARHTFVRLLEEAGFSAVWIARLRGDAQAPEAGLRGAWTYAMRAPEELRVAYLERIPPLPIWARANSRPFSWTAQSSRGGLDAARSVMYAGGDTPMPRGEFSARGVVS